MTSTDHSPTSTKHTDVVRTASIRGQEANLVNVTASLQDGLPCFDVVGLRDVTSRELRIRVRSAITHAGFTFPIGRLTVTFAGASFFDGPAFDLAAAIAILSEQGLLGRTVAGVETLAFFAELSLDGHLRPCRGALPSAVAAKKAGLTGIVVAKDNAAEAALSGLTVYVADTLRSVVDHLTDQCPLPSRSNHNPATELLAAVNDDRHVPDFADVRGMPEAVRALEIAAAGGHHIILIGGPGAGKTMLARRLPGILPSLTLEEALEATTLASVAGLTIGGGLVTRRPFRAPHHSTSPAGLVGGGAPLPRPGELSLAHHGVLFLDELTEFLRQSLEMLREPIASGIVALTRASGTVRYQASAQIVAASNPCSCGLLGHPRLRCRCTREDVARYQRRLDASLGDVFAIRNHIPQVDFQTQADAAPGEATAVIRARVVQARERQIRRAGKLNSSLTTKELQTMVIDDAGKALIQSAQSIRRIRHHNPLLAVARTIADLAGDEQVSSDHLAEALSLQ